MAIYSRKPLAMLLASISLAATANTMPPNTLGQQSNQPSPPVPLQVIYPSISTIVESQISDVEELQLSPAQAKRLKELNLRREQQRATPYNNVPTPVTRTLPINLDPGVTPPVIRLARGQLSTLVFSDGSGQPWFIDSVAMNRQLFTDGRTQAQTDAAPTNILSIEPLTPAAYGNVTVSLKGLSTPVIFVLTSGQAEVDMRVDAKVPGRNPDGYTVSEIVDMPKIDESLTGFLDNVPPKDAIRLRVSGMTGVDAWFYRNDLYVRAKGNVQYPAYIGAARSTSGMSVYKFNGAHSSVTLLSGGEAVTVFIQ